MPSRAPRIAFVIDDLGHGGAQRQLALIGNALHGDAAIKVVVISGTTTPYAERLRQTGAEVTVVPRRSGADVLRLRGLVGELRRFAPDVIHGFLDASNVYAFVAARRLRVPVVLSLRSDRIRMRGIRALVLRSMLRRADAVVVNSRAGSLFLTRDVGVPSIRVHMIPSIVVPNPTGGPAGDPASIGCVGRAVRLKRFDAVIEALPVVRRSLPAARLTIVGDGPCLQALRDLSSARGLGQVVTFTGAVNDATPLIAGFGCLVVASEHEGLPNAALEALAAGVPLAAVPAGDLPELLADGVTGALAADASPQALAGAIVRAVTDPGLRESAAREGPRIVAERFSAERARMELVRLYAGVANESGASTAR